VNDIRYRKKELSRRVDGLRCSSKEGEFVRRFFQVCRDVPVHEKAVRHGAGQEEFAKKSNGKNGDIR